MKFGIRLLALDQKMGAIGIGLAAFFLYLKTLAPGVIWGDSAKLAQFVHDVDLSIRPEYHPLHTLLGILFSYLPVEDYAFRLNIMSACFGALAVGVVYLILLRWTDSVIGAMAGALSLAFSHIFWLLSVITETYTLFSFLLVLIIWLLTLWNDKKADLFLLLAAFVFGLSISNNYLMPFFLPAFLFYYFSAKDRPRLDMKMLFFLSIFLFCGAGIFIFLAAKSLIVEGEHGLADLIQGGAFKRYYRSPTKIVQEMALYSAYLMYQFPLIGFAAGMIGAWRQWRLHRRNFLFLFFIFLADVIFASGYMRQKQFFLLIASYVVFALWIGIGFSSVCPWVDQRWGARSKTIKLLLPALLILLPCGLYSLMPRITSALNLDLVKARTLPYRDNTRFFLVPDKHKEYGSAKYGQEVFNLLEPNSIIIADFTPITVLRYYQKILGIRKDVTLKLVDFDPLDIEFVDRNISKRPIFLANDLEPDYNISGLKTRYEIIPVGPIFKVAPVQKLE